MIPKLGSNNLDCSFTSPKFVTVHSNIGCAIDIAKSIEPASNVVAFFNTYTFCDVSRFPSNLA